MVYDFSFMPVLRDWRPFLDGTLVTLGLSVGATILGHGVAVPSGFAKVHGPAPLRWPMDVRRGGA